MTASGMFGFCTVCKRPVYIHGRTYRDAQRALVAHHRSDHPRRWAKHHPSESMGEE